MICNEDYFSIYVDIIEYFYVIDQQADVFRHVGWQMGGGGFSFKWICDQ